MEERRAEMKQLIEKIDSIVENQKIIKSYIEHQFGGIDLSGNKIEGLMTGTIRRIESKIENHDKDIGDLKNKYLIAYGAIALCMFIIPLVIAIWTKKGL